MKKSVCDICGENTIFNFKIKEGYLCVSCFEKCQKMIDCSHDDMTHIDKSKFIEILQHPAKAQKIKRNFKNRKDVCCICNNTCLINSCCTSDDKFLCEDCISNCVMISEDYNKNSTEFVKEHDSNYFCEELKECYNPKSTIAFNFKTQKIYIKDTFKKSNYKLLDFSDIVSYNYEDINGARKLRLEMKFNEKTIYYDAYSEDNEHYEFDKLMDCLSWIPDLERIDKVNEHLDNSKKDVDSSDNRVEYEQLKCPKCGNFNCVPIVETNTTGRNYSVGEGCCGSIIFGPIGLLCGACGSGKQVNSTTYWMCTHCGNKFQK